MKYAGLCQTLAAKEGELKNDHGPVVEMEALARLLLGDETGRLRTWLQLLDTGSGIVFTSDPDGRPRAFFSGHSAGQLSLNAASWIDAVHPDDRARLPMRSDYDGVEPQRLELRLRDANSEDWRWYLLRAVAERDRDGRIVEWVGFLRDIHERKLQSEQRDIALNESRHRLKNLMAIVEALAKYSAPRPGTEPAIDDFLRRFTGRLHALTAASEAVLAGNLRAIEANAVIHATLAPFLSDLAPRIHVEGPEIQLSEEFGAGLALAVHELATNAIKYGALSVPRGSVSFVWSARREPDGEHVVFNWKEQGGPAPHAPNKDGFGIRMIRAVTAREDTGKVSIDYEPDGLHCRISFVRPPVNAL